MIAVIDDVGAVDESAQDGVGLLSEVYLEADVVDNIVGLLRGVVDAAWDGNDGDEVDEGGAVLAVVDHAGLALLVCGQGGSEVVDSLWRGELAVLSLLYFTVWGLEKATVCAEDFLFGVTGQIAEGRGDVYDWVVETTLVSDDERAGHVDRTEDDLWVRSGGDTSENGEKIETGRGVDGQAKGKGWRYRWNCSRCRWRWRRRRGLMKRRDSLSGEDELLAGGNDEGVVLRRRGIEEGREMARGRRRRMRQMEVTAERTTVSSQSRK